MLFEFVRSLSPWLTAPATVWNTEPKRTTIGKKERRRRTRTKKQNRRRR